MEACVGVSTYFSPLIGIGSMLLPKVTGDKSPMSQYVPPGLKYRYFRNSCGILQKQMTVLLDTSWKNTRKIHCIVTLLNQNQVGTNPKCPNMFLGAWTIAISGIFRLNMHHVVHVLWFWFQGGLNSYRLSLSVLFSEFKNVRALVTYSMMQRWPNPSELRSMDSNIQILCRFKKSKWKFPPPSLLITTRQRMIFSNPLGG